MNPPEGTTLPPTPDLLPGNLREVRQRGLLRCCTITLSEMARITRVGSTAECTACHAIMEVDAAGAWAWQPIATVQALRVFSSYG